MALFELLECCDASKNILGVYSSMYLGILEYSFKTAVHLPGEAATSLKLVLQVYILNLVGVI